MIGHHRSSDRPCRGSVLKTWNILRGITSLLIFFILYILFSLYFRLFSDHSPLLFSPLVTSSELSILKPITLSANLLTAWMVSILVCKNLHALFSQDGLSHVAPTCSGSGLGQVRLFHNWAFGRMEIRILRLIAGYFFLC